MKTLLRKSLSIVMVAILLLANSGLAIFSHTCMLNGSTRVSVLPMKTCQGQAIEVPNGSVVQKQGCCAYGFSLLKVGYSFVKARHFVSNKLMSGVALGIFTPSFLNHIGLSSAISLAYIPPVWYGASNLLQNICILRI